MITALVSAPAASAVDVISQNGISYTGTVTATPVGDVIGMTANSDFPGGITLGDFAFRGAISVGTDLWLLPTSADKVVVVDTTDGTMTGYNLIGVGTTQNMFAGGVFDGTYIWLIPFNANGVLRVRVADGGGEFKGDVDLFNSFPAGITATDAGKFAGGVFANGYVWFVPHNADRVVRLDPSDGTMAGFDGWPVGFTKGAQAFWGGVHDETDIWLVPFDADRIIKVDPTDGSMTEVATSHWTNDLTNYTLPSRAFAGGTWDGSSVWLIPYDSDRVVSIDAATDTMTGYGSEDDATLWPAGFEKDATGASFNGGIFDGEDVWLVPFEADHLVKVDTVTGTMSGYTNFPSTVAASDLDKFAGAGFDGTDIYLVPATRSGQTLVKVFATDIPAVSSITRKTPASGDTNADSVVYTVAFNKTVSGVDTTDFIVNTSGSASGTVSSVSASSGSSIDVTVGSVVGDGAMRLDLKSSGTGIVDAFSNAIAGGFTSGESYAIDNTAPVITSTLTASGVYKTAFSYTITASGLATSFGATGLPAGLSVNSGSGEITGSPTAAGGPTNVTITATDAAGNVDTETLAITIAKRTLTVQSITASDKTYDGNTTAVIDTSSAALSGVVSGDTVTLDKTGAAGAFASATIGTGKTVNITGLAITGASSANYSLTQPSTTADILAGTLTVSGVVASNKFYDGTTSAVVSFGGAALVGIVSGDTVTLNTGSGTGTFASATPGTGKTVTVAGLTISGADAGNYVLQQPTSTANIVAKLLTMSGVGTPTKVYDGNSIATVDFGDAVLVGVVSGDTVGFDAGASTAAFDSDAVGTGKNITITGISLTGANAVSYTLVQPSTTGAITQKPLTVTGVTAEDKVYDGTDAATVSTTGASLVGVVGADDVSLDDSEASASFAGGGAVGSDITVSVSGLTLTGADAGNYSITSPTTTADITAATATVTINGLSQSYNGSPKTVSATTSPSGLSVNFTYNGSSTPPSAVGSYTVVATVDDANHTGTATETLVIGKGTATITFAGTTAVFDGTAKSVSVATVPTGLSVSVTYDGGSSAPSAMGSYTVVATVSDSNYDGSATTTLTIGSNSRLSNISARAQVGIGDDILIPGFVISGTGTKRLLVRGVGPELAGFGVEGELEVPTLALYSGSTVVASNTGWSTADNAEEIAEISAELGAFPLLEGSADCALLADLAPGDYTVHLSGVGASEGVGLVEIYDVDDEGATARLVNVSARAQVGVGADVLIPGFVVDGDGPRTLLVRAVGPGLTDFGVQGVLADPVIVLYKENTEVATNNDWETAANAADVVTATTQVGAFELKTGSKDAALLIELEPGAYTVKVSGAGSTVGVALVEVFQIQ